MSLEAAILASSMNPQMLWEKYPNQIVLSGSLTTSSSSATYTNILSVNAAGYLKGAYAIANPNSGLSCVWIRITADGVSTVMQNTYSTSGSYSYPPYYVQGIVTGGGGDFLEMASSGSNVLPVMTLKNGIGYVRADSSGDGSVMSQNNFTMVPVSSLGTTVTQTAQGSSLMVLSQPLKFNSSLSIDVASSVASLSVSYYALGGHK